MLNRTAWIACLSFSLVCYAMYAPGGTSNDGQVVCVTQASTLTSPQAAIDRATKLKNNFEAIESWTASRLDQAPVVSVVIADPIQPVPASIPVHESFPQTASPIRLVSYTVNKPDGDHGSPQYWPSAETLIDQIKKLQQVPEVQRWSEETITLLQAMGESDPDTHELDNCLNHLEIQLQEIPRLTAAIWKRGNSVEAIHEHCEVSRLAYRLQRRIAVWKTLRSVVDQAGSSRSGVFHSFGSDPSHRSASFARINFESLDPNWVEYLKLKELKDAFGSLQPDELEQKQAARSVLARMYSPVLAPDQAAYIQHVIDPNIVSLLKQHASERVVEADLLNRIENYEDQASALTGYYLNDQYQNLLWSSNPADQIIAAKIQTHYRNANFRFAVSERLLNRLVPELPTTASPVSQNIKGAQVSGRSQVSNQLRIELVPNANQIMLHLATTGNVQSDTIARTKSFRIQNFGKAEFQVVQKIAINPRGIDSSAKPYALSKANQYVVGLESKLDDVPILGWMARKLAAKKLQEEAPETDKLFKRTVESTAENQMQQQVNEQLAKLKYFTYTNLFQPLLAMDLEPESLQMASTEDQVVMRYRLAGRDQMAANTSRPRDSGHSLVSFQLHQSAINNAIARIGLNGNEFTIDELVKHLREVVGSTQIDSPDEESQYAEIGFAHFDPILIRFKDDRLKITLNLSSLKIGESGKVWRNISLTAAYQFKLDGMQIQLLQDDDGTRIKGQRRLGIGDKAAVSAVMKKLFKQEYSMNSLPAKFSERIGGQFLEVSQLVVSDGWLAVSIDDRQSTAAGGNQDQHRIGTIRRLMNLNRR